MAGHITPKEAMRSIGESMFCSTSPRIRLTVVERASNDQRQGESLDIKCASPDLTMT